MGRILAIDYGAKRVGLAVTDPEQIIATGLVTLDSKAALEYIVKYVKQNDVEKILIGYPLDLRGNITHSTAMVENFIKQLKKYLPETIVEKRDEAYTSKMAMRTLIESGAKKKDRQNKALLDKISATIILQEYLHNI